MEKLPAHAGWTWVTQGFALFRKQPAEMSTLFLSYMFLMLVVGIIPLIGQTLPLLLIPVFSMAFMQACVNIEQGKRVYPNLLLTGFRSPAFTRLLKLGMLYLASAALAIGISSFIDGGLFWQVMTGNAPVDAKTIQDAHMSLAMIFAALIYTPAAMALWYAAPLIAWQGMGIGKAIFYSFFAVRRAGKEVLVYGLAWLLIGVLLPALISSILALIIGKTIIVMLVLMPVSIIMTVIMYCSFYPNYTQVFGPPSPAAPLNS